jgi:hypothetical protein
VHLKDYSTSQLTPPLIIYKFTFGGSLMKNWATFKAALVLFTAVLNDHISHDYLFAIVIKSTIVLEWIDETSKIKKSQVMYKFMETGMASNYKPPDLVTCKPSRNAIKRQNEMYRNEFANTFVAGFEIKISSLMLTQSILITYARFNDYIMCH